MGKRYCLLDCEDAEKWKGHEQYYKRMFEPDATWDIYKVRPHEKYEAFLALLARCINGKKNMQCYLFDLPKAEKLAEYDGVFITGSHYSAYDNVTWIKQLKAYLKNTLHAKRVQAKVVGLCFGCQVLADALGGKVGKNPDGAFVLKVEDLTLQPAALARPDFATLFSSPQQPTAASSATMSHSKEGPQPEGPPTGPPGTSQLGPSNDAADGTQTQQHPCLRLIQSHGDQVLRLPSDADLLCSSDTAGVEVWGWGDVVLAVQGHPELDTQSVLDKILPALSSNGRLSDVESAASRHSLEAVCPTTETALQLIKAFLNAPRPMQRKAISQPASEAATDATNSSQQGSVEAASTAGSTQGATARPTAIWDRVTSWPILRGLPTRAAPTGSQEGPAADSETKSVATADDSAVIGAHERAASSPAMVQHNVSSEEGTAGPQEGAPQDSSAGSSALRNLWSRMSSLQASIAAVPSVRPSQDGAASDTASQQGVDASKVQPADDSSGTYTLAQGMLRGITALLPPVVREGTLGAAGAPPSPGASVAASDGDPAEKEALLLHKADMVEHHLRRAIECEVRQGILDMDTLTDCNRAVAKRYTSMGAYATGMAAFVQALEAKCEAISSELLPAVQHVDALLSQIERRVEQLENTTADLCRQLGILDDVLG